MAYQYLPHTADLRASVAAPDLASLYQSAVDLVRETLVGRSPVKPRLRRRIRPEGEAESERFFRFVRELVYLYDAEGFVPAEAVVGDPLEILGETFDVDRHTSERQLKALTRHGFSFEQGDAGYSAEMIFDL